MTSEDVSLNNKMTVLSNIGAGGCIFVNSICWLNIVDRQSPLHKSLMHHYQNVHIFLFTNTTTESALNSIIRSAETASYISRLDGHALQMHSYME